MNGVEEVRGLGFLSQKTGLMLSSQILPGTVWQKDELGVLTPHAGQEHESSRANRDVRSCPEHTLRHQPHLLMVLVYCGQLWAPQCGAAEASAEEGKEAVKGLKHKSQEE